MINPKDWLEFGQKFHGHKCPAMPMGLRVGAAAMNALGVERAKDGQLVAFVDLGEDHCATCYGDGLQVILGTTFGKGNIKKTHKGKWAVTVVERATGRAVRVTPTAEAMLNNKKSSFFTDYRMVGKPASTVPAEVVDPLVISVMSAPDEKLFSVSPIFEYKLEPKKDSFNGFVCEECGEMTVTEYGRIKGDKKVCIDCLNK
ncbi:MAG TPA: FmdE family protein [Williamwhitmania sp.]|nr:FmdE family protein [Williamwhitmania sp.]HUX54007.1 FmdE family protein [Williamwhitmania sp.]